jgi:hypothetical protein
MPHDAHPVLSVTTHPGATCTASVTYDGRRRPASFRKYLAIWYAVTGDGVVRWGWHEQPRGAGGVGVVTCRYQGHLKTAHARFVVSR